MPSARARLAVVTGSLLLLPAAAGLHSSAGASDEPTVPETGL